MQFMAYNMIIYSFVLPYFLLLIAMALIIFIELIQIIYNLYVFYNLLNPILHPLIAFHFIFYHSSWSSLEIWVVAQVGYFSMLFIFILISLARIIFLCYYSLYIIISLYGIGLQNIGIVCQYYCILIAWDLI